MEINKDLKIGIVTSVTATALFIYFLDPILTFFGRSFVKLLTRFYSGYVDGLFQKIALCSTFDAAFSLLYLITATICGVSLGVCIGLVKIAIRRKKELSSKAKPPLARISLGKAIVISIIFTLLLYVWSISTMWSGLFQLKITSSFHQHMKAIAPFLTEQEEENLWSEWTQMSSRQDYGIIYSQLRTIAQNNDIRLPKNKMYP